MSYREPTRAIFVASDLQKFIGSKAYEMILIFVKHLNQSVRGLKINADIPISPNSKKVIEMIQEINSWIDEIPPLQQPMRFGNKAFRTFYERLEERSCDLHKQLLPEDLEPASIELMAYLKESFGNQVRIDYGTGHETNFIVWLLCLHKIGFLAQSDFPAMVLRIFTQYIALMRRLQTIYMLEPAGSHGVWGLDDYHCLPFYFGSTQLIGQLEIVPESIHDNSVLEAQSSNYLYLDAIKFIKEVKKGSPFAETSPMLNDISALPTWEKINGGMWKLYEGEVLKKLPVIQHLCFGTLLPCTWSPSQSSESQRVPVSAPPGTTVHAPNFDLDGVSTTAPWVAVESLTNQDTVIPPVNNKK